jgi:hypothetical protein
MPNDSTERTPQRSMPERHQRRTSVARPGETPTGHQRATAEEPRRHEPTFFAKPGRRRLDWQAMQHPGGLAAEVEIADPVWRKMHVRLTAAGRVAARAAMISTTVCRGHPEGAEGDLPPAGYPLRSP